MPRILVNAQIVPVLLVASASLTQRTTATLNSTAQLTLDSTPTSAAWRLVQKPAGTTAHVTAPGQGGAFSADVGPLDVAGFYGVECVVDFNTPGAQTIGISILVPDSNTPRDPYLDQVINNDVTVTNVRAHGALGDAVHDDTPAFVSALATGQIVYIPKGVYRVIPSLSVALKLVTGTRIFGAGKMLSVLVCDGVAGTLFGRTFTPGVANPYVFSPHLRDFAIVLTHPVPQLDTNYVQRGIDLTHISRPIIENVFIGNIAKATTAGGAGYDLVSGRTLNAAVDDIQGYGIVCGTYPAANVAYCGGEGPQIRWCQLWGLKDAVSIDNASLIGAASGAHGTVVENCDIQFVEHGISQLAQYADGCKYTDNIIQAVQRGRNSASQTACVEIWGINSKYVQGPTEAPNADLHLRYGPSALNNRAELNDGSLVFNEMRVYQATVTTPVRIETVSAHGREVGDIVTIADLVGFTIGGVECNTPRAFKVKSLVSNARFYLSNLDGSDTVGGGSMYTGPPYPYALSQRVHDLGTNNEITRIRKTHTRRDDGTNGEIAMVFCGNKIKTTVSTDTNPHVYSGAGLTGSIGATTMSPARRITLTTAVFTGTYVLSAITVTGLDPLGNAQTDTLTPTLVNGGETLTTSKRFGSVVSLSVPQQNNGSGSFTFGVDAETALHVDEVLPVDTTGGVVVVNLPAEPRPGMRYTLVDFVGNCAVKKATLSGNGRNIDGATTADITAAWGRLTVLDMGTFFKIV